MKSLSKNYLLIAKLDRIDLFSFFLIIGFTFTRDMNAQIGNYINNGSFENYYDCISPNPISKAKFWLSIDSLSVAGGFVSICNQTIPFFGGNYQYPRSGGSCLVSTLYSLDPPNIRGYMKNRLKQNLQAGKIYCVKFFINVANLSPRGMDGFGVYFSSNIIDTITKCNIPLSYITPQIFNPMGNVITDTLNWVPITGTFLANGSEKYALIGNFLADNAVTTVSLNSPYYPEHWTDVLIDDVSCIELNLPAYAGPDQTFFPTDSVFIGRQPDFAIDPGCVWYQLPNATPIATISGLWVKPAVTTTYVVRQELDCSPLKYDTVVVYRSPVGIKSYGLFISGLEVYPVPADEIVELRVRDAVLYKNFTSLSICNSMGQVLRKEEVFFKGNAFNINISDLPEGISQLQLNSVTAQTVSKRLVVAR